MSTKTKIEWTDATWNPVRGCTKISPGCKHCYAETFAERFRGVKGHPYEKGFDLRLVPEKLTEPLTWSSPSMVFVNSMSDLFHDGIDEGFIVGVVTCMMMADWHTYQVLTKRASRLRKMLATSLKFAAECQHIWWGVSVEDVEHGVPRIAELRGSHAGVRFLSIEPLLQDLGKLELSGIDWVIVGGESGAGARPMQESWVDNVHKQCRRDRIPFFFKQWGGVRKAETGRKLHGRTFDEFPKIERTQIPELSVRRAMRAWLEAQFGGRT